MPATYKLQLDWSNYLTGGNNNDTIKGTSASEILNGRNGIDTAYGGAGDDVYIIGSSGDQVIEYDGEGMDAVISWSRSFILPNYVENLQMEAISNSTGVGNGLDNVILGSRGNNTIRGEGGNDVIIGAHGSDDLYGGSGFDTFVYGASEEGVDTIHDFQVGVDALDFSGLLAASVDAEAVTGASGSGGPITKTIKEVTYVPVTTTTGNADLKYDMPISKGSYRVIDLDDISTRGSIKLGANENVLFLGPDEPWTGDQFKVIGGNHVALVGGTFKPTSNSGPTTINFDDFKGSLYIEGVEIDNSNVGARDALRFGGKNGSRPDVIIQNSSFENVTGAQRSAAHGDIIQPMGPVGDIKMYNFTGSTTYQGLFFSNQPHKSGADIQGVDLENVNLKYNGGSKSYVLWLDQGQDVDLKNVFVEERSGYSAQSWSVWPPGGSRSGDTIKLNKYGFDGEVKVGTPPGGDFVDGNDIGSGYVQGTATKTEYKEVITYKTVTVDSGDGDPADPSSGSDNELKFIQEGSNTVVYVDEDGDGNYTKLVTLKNVDASELAASYNDGSSYTPPTTQPPADDTPDPDTGSSDPDPDTGSSDPDPDTGSTDGGDDGTPSGPRQLQDIPNIRVLDPDNWLLGSNNKNDNISGTSGNDYLNGRGKDDVMSGKDGNDTYVVNSNNDKLIESSNGGIDIVVSWSLKYELEDNIENARLERGEGELDGNNLDNTILGSTGDNRIFGNGGDDIIIGSRGKDVLAGGTGSDIFVYEEERDGGDIILDFETGEDVMDFRQLDISMSDIEVKSGSNGAEIFVNNTLMATLDDVQASDVDTSHDFWL